MCFKKRSRKVLKGIERGQSIQSWVLAKFMKRWRERGFKGRPPEISRVFKVLTELWTDSERVY